MTLLAESHEMNPARLSLEEVQEGSFSGTWMFPTNAVGLPAEVSFTDCEEEQRDLPAVEGKYLVANICLLYTSPSPRDGNVSRMPSSA